LASFKSNQWASGLPSGQPDLLFLAVQSLIGETSVDHQRGCPSGAMRDPGLNGPYPIVHLAAAAACRSSPQVQVLVASSYPLGNDAVGGIAGDAIERGNFDGPLVSCRLFDSKTL